MKAVKLMSAPREKKMLRAVMPAGRVSGLGIVPHSGDVSILTSSDSGNDLRLSLIELLPLLRSSGRKTEMLLNGMQKNCPTSSSRFSKRKKQS